MTIMGKISKCECVLACIPRTGGRGEFSSKLARLILVEAVVVVREDAPTTTVAQVVVVAVR
jgi:hypothetical protein